MTARDNWNEYHREYYRRNAEHLKARAKARYRRLHPPKQHIKKTAEEKAFAMRMRKRRFQQKLKRDVILGYGGKCACCGTTYLPHLTLDHINSNGAEERRQFGGIGIYRRLRNEGYSDPTYQVLCFNCNAAKYYFGQCRCMQREQISDNLFIDKTIEKEFLS